MNKALWMLAAALAMIVAPTATMAQIRVTRDMPVNVRLEIAPDPPLSIAVSPISFGTVRIPNKLKVGTVCSYVMDQNGTVRVVDSTAPIGQTVPQSPGGCAQTQVGQVGIVNVTCDDLRVVNSGISAAAATGPRPNLSFAVGAFAVDGSSQTGLTNFCRGGTQRITVGGTLTVGQDYTLPVAQTINVATIQISVEYR